MSNNKVAYFKNIWEEQYGKDFEEELSREYSEADDNYREAAKYGEERSALDVDVFEYSEENKEVFGLGEVENREQQDKLNSGRSNAHSFSDSEGIRNKIKKMIYQ